LEPADPLNFVDKKPYSERLKEEQERTGLREAAIVGTGMVRARHPKRLEPGHAFVADKHVLNRVVVCVPDVLTGCEKRGPQLNDLSLLMRNAFCCVHLRRLRCQTTEVSTPALLCWMRTEVPKKYERDYVQLWRSAYDGPGGRNRRDLSSYFCSELVAQAYIEAGLLDGSVQPSNEYTPADFAGDRLPLSGMCYLDDACAIC
ncbi:hypothetical protein LCGC14_2303830, partial [marine sediment metagenome]